MNRRQGCAWWGCAAILLLLATGCANNGAPKTAAAEAWSTWGIALQMSEAVYGEAMIATGRAYSAGLITLEQRTKIRDAGRITELALRGAKEALVVYGQAMADKQEAPSPRELVLAAHRELMALLAMMSQYGIKYGGVL